MLITRIDALATNQTELLNSDNSRPKQKNH